ncbi:hypothetical protein [Alishewanella sp. HL-SH06]|uniref:hypothetical protein n=1 Tax=Alishewanella sp. HL-SH06 TaxID=3461144 RepID=UPI00404155E4
MALAARYRRAAIKQQLVTANWQSGNDITAQVRMRFSSAPAIILNTTANWAITPVKQQHWQLGWQVIPLQQQQVKLRWRQLPLQQQHTLTHWRMAALKQQQNVATWGVSALHTQQLQTGYIYPGITAKRFDLLWRTDGEVTRYYRLPYGPRPPSYICTQNYVPPSGKVTLRFIDPAQPQQGNVTLRFSNANNPIVCVLDNGGGLMPPSPEVPTIDTSRPIRPARRRSYIMQPQLRCYRVSDNLEINIISASWAINRSSWAANITLNCGSRIDRDRLLTGGPQLFKLVVNGYELFGLAENGSMSHSFGQSSWTITGRSSIAELASPNAAARSYTNTTSKSVAALITDELDNTGWSLNFDMLPFNVPAGAFSYQNKTPIEAIAQIVAGIGGMLYPDGSTNTLHVKPQWPVVPWGITIATADVAVHDDVILNYSESPASTPACNAVFVRGEQQGVECKVRRSGTAGDVLANDIVDPIITDQLAARQRGTAELAECGRKTQISITLPVMQDLPLCLPGTLLGVAWQTDIYKGMVDSVNLTASRNNDGSMTVRQTVGVIRSYE